MSFNSLVLGNKYSKKDLSEIFGNPNISIVREGIYNVSNSESFFFVDLEKKGKEERFHFDDFFKKVNKTDIVLSKIIKDDRQDSLLVGFNITNDGKGNPIKEVLDN